MTDLFIGIYPYVVCALLLYALIVALRRYFVGALNPAEAPASKPSAPAFAVLRTILIAFVLSRALIWTVAYVGNALSGSLDTYLDNQLFIWTQWDAPHYLGIAENGYVTEGDARLHILPDTYHMAYEETDPLGEVRRLLPRIPNLHISDDNRFFPGYGGLDFGAYLQGLQAMGYQGTLGVEGNLHTSLEADLQRTAETLLRAAGTL